MDARKANNFVSIAQFLDAHLLLKLLDKSLAMDIFEKQSVLQKKLKILQNTHNNELARKTFTELFGKQPSKGKNARALTPAQCSTSTSKTSRKSAPSAWPRKTPRRIRARSPPTRSSSTRQGITKVRAWSPHSPPPESEEILLDVTRTQALTTETTLSSENYLRSLWGLLAAQILNDKLEEAYETHVRLRDTIDKFEFARTVDQFNQRVWLANWSLFFFFSIENGP